MASNIRELQPSDDGFGQWSNSVKDMLRERTICKSSDILLHSANDGTSIQLHPRFKYPSVYMNYRGDWSPTSSYNVNDVVRVYPDRKYTYGSSFQVVVTNEYKDASVVVPPRKPPLIIGDTTFTQSAFASLGVYTTVAGKEVGFAARSDNPMPGTWICVAPIPSAFDEPELFSTTGIGGINYMPTTTTPMSAFSQFVQNNIQYMRLGNVNYSPEYPEWSNVAVLNRGDLSKSQGRYWELLSLPSTVTAACLSGKYVYTFIDNTQLPSGSMYSVTNVINPPY